MPNPERRGALPPNQNQVNINQPEAFDFTKPETWPIWEKRFLRFISIANLSWKTDKEKTDLLCYTMGVKSEGILLRILPNAETKSFNDVLKAFNDHFIPKRNIILKRFNFNSRVQLSGESVDDFITALYSLAEECDYSTAKEDLIRDRIVIGIRDSKTSVRLQSKSDLTLATAIAEVRQAELQEQESKLLRQLKDQEASRARKCTHFKGVKGSGSDNINCRQCGFPSHSARQLCPAKHSRCKRCGGYGHWDRVCIKKNSLSENNEVEKFGRGSAVHSSGQSSDSGATFIDHPGLRAVANSCEKFSESFFKALVRSNPDNLITSPLGVQILLAMAAYGAGGHTASEMHTVLQLHIENSISQSGYLALIETLSAEKAVELRIASKIFFASYVRVKLAYQELTTKIFLSPSQCIDFRYSRAAAQTINTWCEKQTNSKITNVIEPDSFQPNTGSVLVNALYFKGQWEFPFDRYATEKCTFHVDETYIKRVCFMSRMSPYRFGDLPKLDAKFIEIPYKGETLSMIIILPNKIMGLKTVQDNLYKVNLRQSLQEVDPRLILLNLPKFKIKNSFSLQQTLKTLGMTHMFQLAADFSGITDCPLNITDVVQTAFIEVNETGTEAATFPLLSEGGSAVREFIVDRPFYFTIYHHYTGISLFTGIVREPAFE